MSGLLNDHAAKKLRLLFLFLSGLMFSLSVAAQNISKQIIFPANSTISAYSLRPLWTATAKEGDALYLRIFESHLLKDETVAIPRFTYVSGKILSIKRPTRKVPQTVFLMQFDSLIFVDGYVVQLSTQRRPLRAVITFEADPDNELLIDRGTVIEFPVRDDLVIDRTHVEKSEAMYEEKFSKILPTASKCRPESSVYVYPSLICGAGASVSDTDCSGHWTQEITCPRAPLLMSAVLTTLSDKNKISAPKMSEERK